ncbi:MAG: branched-chain amino acid ABC transporter permease [Labrys sp. (in: a-proteobacteria)]
MTTLFITLLDSLNFVLILMLVALGLAVIFGLMNVINMAHGEFVMLGAYVVLVLHQAGLPVLIGIAAAPVIVGLFGLVVELLLIRRVYTRLLDTILATWGLSLLIRQGVTLAFGPGSHAVPKPIDGSVLLGGADYPVYRLAVMAATLVIVAATFWFFFRTRAGLAARAVIANRDMAACLGVDTRALDRLTFTLGTGLAGLAGAIMAPLISIDPQMGIGFLVPSFLAILVGGLGSVAAPFAGAGIVGGAQTLISTVWSPVAAEVLVLCLAILLIRLFPAGILASRGRQA